MWIDRRFSVAGAGTVVTGTLLGGEVAVGDTLTAYPGETELRIRGIESHEESLERVEPHRRVALNLVGNPTGLDRGTMLGLARLWTMTDRFTAQVRAARYVEALGERGAYQLHTGTAAVTCRLRPLGSKAVVTLTQPLPLRYGDRFILRETGRRAVVGGGTVLDPDPPRRGRGLRAAAGLPPGLSATEAADALLVVRGSDEVARLVAHTGARPSGGIVGEVAVTP
jgi:selenocysteine-specific elongation factor